MRSAERGRTAPRGAAPSRTGGQVMSRGSHFRAAALLMQCTLHCKVQIVKHPLDDPAESSEGYCGAHSGQGTPFLTQIGFWVQPMQQCVLFGHCWLREVVPPATAGWKTVAAPTEIEMTARTRAEIE